MAIKNFNIFLGLEGKTVEWNHSKKYRKRHDITTFGDQRRCESHTDLESGINFLPLVVAGGRKKYKFAHN